MVSSMKLLVFFLVFTVLGISNVVVDSETGVGNAVECRNDLSSFLPSPYSHLPNMVCKRLWNSFLLQYSQTEENVVTVVLSTAYSTGWVGMGFSKDGMMLNASCMVGWITPEGHARTKQYYVEGFTSDEIKVDKGELPLTGVPPYVALQAATIYLAFQLKYPTPLKRQPILLAYSSKYPHHHHLTIHDDKTTLLFDFSAGDSTSSAGSASNVYDISSTKKTHGALSVIGWGLFLPYGAILARYLKHKDPLWFYLHVVIQFLSFFIGLAAVVVGVSLNNRLHADIQAHKTIGIFVLVLTILQVMAFFARPNKDSKRRKYWNWYHSWTGRTAIFLAAVNMMLGIHMGDAGRGWKIGYGFLLGLSLFACVVLEALSRLRRSKNEAPFHPDFQMNTI